MRLPITAIKTKVVLDNCLEIFKIATMNSQSFTHNRGDKYIVTGLKYNTKTRFRQEYDSPYWALGINLWRGSVWQVKAGTNKRQLIKRVN